MIGGDRKDGERRLKGGEKQSKTERDIEGASERLRGGMKEERRRREGEENERRTEGALRQRRVINTRDGSYVRVLTHGAVFSIILMLQNPHPLRNPRKRC